MNVDDLVNERVTDNDPRNEAAFAEVLALEMEGVPGRVRGLSGDDIYFETDALDKEIGPLVKFSMEYQQAGRVRRLECEAQVVRVEGRGDRIGIAAKLLEPLFQEP